MIDELCLDLLTRATLLLMAATAWGVAISI